MSVAQLPNLGFIGMPDNFFDQKIFPNNYNLAFPSQISKVPMVEYISRVEVVSLDSAAQLKLPVSRDSGNNFCFPDFCCILVVFI